MDIAKDDNETESNFSERNIQRLKEKYSKEMKDSEDNPMKVCMKLVFSSATEKNPQKRLELSLSLSEFLTKPDGIINLFLALLDFDSSSQISTTHNQRFIAVANIITCLPKLCLPYEEYCASIFHQIRPLIISEQSKYSTLACLIVKSMLESPHAKTNNVSNILFDPIFKPLQGIDTDESKTHEAIIAIHNMLQNHLPVNLFVGIFPQLFYSLLSLKNIHRHLRSLLKTSLTGILDSLEPGVANCLLEETLFYNHETSVIHDLEAEASDKVIDMIVTLIESCNELLVLEFYFHFQELMWTAKDQDSRRFSASLIEPLLIETVEEKSTKLDLLTIIANNSEKSIELILRTLLNYISFLRSSSAIDMEGKLIDRSINSCLSILEVMCSAIHEFNIQNLLEKKCLPILEELQGAISNCDQKQELYRSVKLLVDRLRAAKEKNNFVSENVTDIQAAKDLNNIMKDLNDKLVPVRVHALVRLKQLVLGNVKFVVTQIEKLYPIVEVSMSDPEPYVYLAAINLIVEMSVRKTEFMLPKFMEVYANDSLDTQHRINAGEVLVRVIKQLNETTPFYASQTMETLLKACSDADELIRISSLTNLGEVCRYLAFSLGKYIIGILNLVENILDTDTISVKCAAIDLLRSTLMGLDRLKVESIQKELNSIYKVLKRVRCRTLDDKLCLQADLALDEIDRLAHELLLGDVNSTDNSLVKEIKVMSLLDN